ncbi:MAG TPA: MFS transporter [Sphingobacteriaceae bacterium]
MVIKNRQRLSISLFFFLSGICFATWTSRIPSIKTTFDLNEAELGTLLLAMPIGSIIGLPISGWLVSKFDSRIPLLVSFIITSISLALIGLAPNAYILALPICLFSFTMRIFSISVNTQAITLQKLSDNKILGSFHGLWSAGGIAGILLTTLMVALNISLQLHLVCVTLVSLIATVFSYRYLLKDDRPVSGNKLILSKPDPYIVYLGLLVFFSAVCEGGMFDWSGIYFQDVLKIKVFTYGYLVFMTCMAISRFLSDSIVDKIGMPATYTWSAACIIIGIGSTILFTNIWAAMIGFSLVGLGTAAIIPLSYSLAGLSKKYSPGMAISIIATYAISGMLIGPPMIGYLAHAFNLQTSFITFAVCGVMIMPISRLFFRHQKRIASLEKSVVSDATE